MKIFIYFFVYIYKNGKKIFQKKKTKKSFKKKHLKHQNHSEEQKEKKGEYMRNYYLAPKNNFIGFYKVL